jgi:hypothetical protein
MESCNLGEEIHKVKMVGLGGLEPPISPSSDLRSLVTDLSVLVLWS